MRLTKFYDKFSIQFEYDLIFIKKNHHTNHILCMLKVAPPLSGILKGQNRCPLNKFQPLSGGDTVVMSIFGVN